MDPSDNSPTFSGLVSVVATSKNWAHTGLIGSAVGTIGNNWMILVLVGGDIS
jgi:hypothetical protein